MNTKDVLCTEWTHRKCQLLPAGIGQGGEVSPAQGQIQLQWAWNTRNSTMRRQSTFLYACSGLRTTCLALQTLLYHSLFFYREEMFSIINHVVLVFPEPSPWKGDPELVSGSVVTVSRSNWFPWWEGEKVFPGTFQSQRSWTDTSALVKREKDQGPSNDITLRWEETVPNHVTDFSLWQWFWKGIHIILAI